MEIVPHENCRHTLGVHVEPSVFINSLSNWATANRNCIYSNNITVKTCWLCPSNRIDRLHTNTVNILLFNPIHASILSILHLARWLWQICRSVCKYFFFRPLWKYWLRFTTVHNLSVYVFVHSVTVDVKMQIDLPKGLGCTIHTRCNLLSPKGNENGIESFQCLSTIKYMQHIVRCIAWNLRHMHFLDSYK